MRAAGAVKNNGAQLINTADKLKSPLPHLEEGLGWWRRLDLN
jgi:hypothetical protein